MGDFKKLKVWRKAQALSINVHRIAMKMRGPGIAQLRNQMMRAAGSIPTNIVEGHGYDSPKDFARFLGYSLNSGAELEQHLLTSLAIGAMSKSDYLAILSSLIEVRKMTYGLRASLRRQLPKDGRKGKRKIGDERENPTEKGKSQDYSNES